MLVRDVAAVATTRSGAYAVEIVVAILLTACSYGVPMVWGMAGANALITVASLTVLVICTVVCLLMGPTMFLTYWIVLSVTQNFFVGIWHGSAQTEIPLLVTESKTLVLVLAAIFYVGPILRYLKSQRAIVLSVMAYFLLLLIHLRKIDGATLAYLRNFMAPLVILFVAAAVTAHMVQSERLKYLRSLALGVIVLMFCGSIAELLVGTEEWRLLVNAESSGALSSLSETTSFLGYTLPRIGGILVEPTNAGYVAAIAFLVFALPATMKKESGSISLTTWAGLFFSVLIMGLAAAKSGALMLLIALVCFYLFRSRLRSAFAFILGWVFAFSVTAFYVVYAKGLGSLGPAFTNPVAIVGGDSTTFHFAGFIYGLRSVVGHGIGVGGNFNRISGESWIQWLGTGSESSWGVLAYQSGLLGLLLWLIALCIVGEKWGYSSAVLLCSWAAGAMFAEAMIGPQVAGLAMVGAALMRADHAKPLAVNSVAHTYTARGSL
ncbi:hypothetical protein [Pseudarthrobacter equi]|uniref:hypothetical protein n=1 Tax=Pseudarthrobacter equi TaxID=728066 RepID=UPI0028D0892E|nr:hypothetical protein [Pseudarthrobacter equi]